MIANVELPLPYEKYEDELIGSILQLEKEGEDLLKEEPAYEKMDKAIAYLMGEQLEGRRPKELSAVVDNITKHITLQTVAALTDIHPLFGFKTHNPDFQDTADVLEKLTIAWWVNNFCDIVLADVIRYAAGVGTGYIECRWDPAAFGGIGDVVLIARDPRDVIPIKPTYDHSLQTWEGVIVRSASSVSELRSRYPDKQHRIDPDRVESSLAGRTWTRARRLMSQVISPTTVDLLTRTTPKNMPARVAATDVYTVYVKDRRFHTGAEPVVIGDPDTTWGYTVYPVNYIKPDGSRATVKDARLYPRGRMIICTRKAVLYDGPNPYWHGMFPLAKLSLDPWPWGILGLGVVHDLMPLQDAVNEISNGILDHIRKILRPGLVADKKVVPDSIWQRIDTRIAGLKIKSNPAAGKNLDYLQEPPLPTYVLDFLRLMVSEMERLSGTANLAALTQLQQAPGADSIERLLEALTPILRLKGRLMEAFLRELAEMVKSNFFQFYTMPRRVSILGEAGLSFNDFDFEPGTMVPAMSSEDTEYEPHLDKKLTRWDRAQWYMKNFTFRVTPNSLLAISQISRKMLHLQLWRGGLMDPWTLFEVLEIPNGGTPPAGATTIVDRLVIAMAMGLVGQVSPAGRKSTGQEAPSLQSKGDGRTVVSESG